MGLQSFFKKRDLDEQALEAKNRYQESFIDRVNKKQGLKDIEFSVIDTETTGLDPAKDRLLTVGVVKVIDFSIPVGQSYEGLIKLKDYVPGQEVKVHGIINRHLDKGSPEIDVLVNFLDCIGSSIIVGHHIGFDVKVLNRALKDHLGIKLRNKVLDTGILDRRIENIHDTTYRPKKLDELCEKYGIPALDRHTAIGDAYATALIFIKILKLLQKRGVTNLTELI